MIRLMIRGLVDGALSSLGVVIGASLSNNLQIILSAGFSGAVANGFSNILAAFTAEKTSQYQKLDKIEKKMLKSLKGTKREKAINKDIIKGGALDGAFSLVGGVLPILPFFFMDTSIAIYGSVALVTIMAAYLGVYTGKHSKENLFMSSLKMIIFTLATAGICALIQFVI
ncbi:MAG: VIT1/CCC1 transporter family protein [Nanobdellota archaeon]